MYIVYKFKKETTFMRFKSESSVARLYVFSHPSMVCGCSCVSLSVLYLYYRKSQVRCAYLQLHFIADMSVISLTFT